MFCLRSLCSLTTIACINAASAIVSSTRDCASQMRNSMVSKNGCSRMSHQIFFALSMQPVETNSFK